MLWLGVGSIVLFGGAFLLVSIIVLLIAGPFMFSGGDGPERAINNSEGIPPRVPDFDQ